ncbi:MAG: acetylxylan esterase [Rhodopirellula sp.]|nr:acetylxylan esterase [Rhodopirellula sp.]OUX50997.1 MAG: hypothetical protein CBE43_05065 [Rhodopirellula sp. TMED283]
MKKAHTVTTNASRIPALALVCLLQTITAAGLCRGQVVVSDYEPRAEPWKAQLDLVQKNTQRREEFNYQEAKVPDYALPDPLVSAAGKLIATADDWNRSRREELLSLFRNQVYGKRPEINYTLSFEQAEEQPDVWDGLATGRSMVAVLSVGGQQYKFPFVLFLPNDVKGRVPAVIHINNRYFIPLQKAVDENDPFWPAKTIVQRGYATASFHTSDVDPDKKDGYEKGIRFFLAGGVPPTPTAWRSLSAWGWAASRVLDHLEMVSAIDADKVAVVGHSRGGKTSLWAACEDPRFAVAYSNNSGCGGAALSRRAYGETVGRITSSFPHWFCESFSKYADREAQLPVDQHEVMALIAPRSVYVASSDEDLWADPKGEYASLVAAAPVFELLGKKSITETTMPALNTPRVVGNTGYHIRSGGHGLGEVDWNWFLDFTDSVLQ